MQSSQKSQSIKPLLPPVSHSHPQETLSLGKSHEKSLSSTLKVGSQTNWKGDKKCFQCGKFGHLMYNCADCQLLVVQGVMR